MGSEHRPPGQAVRSADTAAGCQPGDQFQVVPLAAAAVQVKNKRHIFHRSRRRIKPVADHAAVAQRKMLLCKGGLLNLLLVLLLLRNSGLRLALSNPGRREQMV